MSKLDNLNALLNDMSNKQWHITVFPFKFNNIDICVIVQDRSCFERKAGDIIAKLIFVRIDNSEQVIAYANRYSLQVIPSELKQLFGIFGYQDYKTFMFNFYKALALQTPITMNNDIVKKHKLVLLNILNKHEPNSGICCYAIKHNANNGQRSPFNDTKARLYCPEIYDYFYKDTNISFCFRKDSPLTLSEILNNSIE